MTTTGRHQRRYDHRLRDLVQRTGDVTVATNLGVPRSTARGWLRQASKVVTLDVTNLKTSELQREVLVLRRRVKKLHHRARLFHIHHKPLYRAVGETDNRYRRPTTLPRAIERLMVLDAVLAERDRTWLATEQEKFTYFTLTHRIPRQDSRH